MTVRRGLLVLAVLLALTAAAVRLDTTARRAPKTPSGAAAPTVAATTSPTTPPSTASDQRRSRATQVAIDYTLSAANWSPMTYRSAWRERLRLAFGGHRADLLSERPDPALIAQLRADNRYRLGALLQARGAEINARDHHRVEVVLDEVHLAAGRRERASVTYRVDVIRARTGWAVAGFTSMPGRAGS